MIRKLNVETFSHEYGWQHTVITALRLLGIVVRYLHLKVENEMGFSSKEVRRYRKSR